MRVPRPVRARDHQDQLSSPTITESSAMRLGRGGRARLARVARNHHPAISGKTACSPRVNTIVRVWVRS